MASRRRPRGSLSDDALSGLLPICAYCKKVRNDKNYWEQVETYVADRSEAQFSHSICPGCYEDRVKPELETLRRERRPAPEPPASG